MTATMIVPYRQSELPLIQNDSDLVPLLCGASNELLDPLVGYLTKTGKGEERWTEELTRTEVYQQHYPDHHHYASEIAAELQLYGGHTIANTLRGHGVPYREICCDVAARLKVNFNPQAAIEMIESAILMKVLEDAWDRMNPTQRATFLEELGLSRTKIGAGLPIHVMRMGIQAGGFLSYRVAVTVANQVSRMLLNRGLTFAANRGLTRWLSVFAGPVGAVLNAAWIAYDVGAPAYRVTIPCVIQVALIRQIASSALCPNSHPNAPSSRFCTECGEPLPDPDLDGFGGI